jgi:hypothetical protein
MKATSKRRHASQDSPAAPQDTPIAVHPGGLTFSLLSRTQVSPGSDRYKSLAYELIQQGRLLRRTHGRLFRAEVKKSETTGPIVLPSTDAIAQKLSIRPVLSSDAQKAEASCSRPVTATLLINEATCFNELNLKSTRAPSYRTSKLSAKHRTRSSDNSSPKVVLGSPRPTTRAEVTRPAKLEPMELKFEVGPRTSICMVEDVYSKGRVVSSSLHSSLLSRTRALINDRDCVTPRQTRENHRFIQRGLTSLGRRQAGYSDEGTVKRVEFK